MFDDLDTEWPCGGTVHASVDDVARGRAVRCSRGCDVALQDGGGAVDASRAARDLEASLDGLSRTIKFES